MPRFQKRDNPNTEYFITLFKIEGHDLWRAQLHSHEGDFEKFFGADVTNKAVITEKKLITIDRLTGKVSVGDIIKL